MEPLDYLRAIRRRWLVVAGSVIVALGVGFATTAVVPVGPPVRSYESSTILLRNAGLFQDNGTMEAIAALAKVGEVPRRVAARMGTGESAVQLAAQVDIGTNPKSGLLNIVASGTDPRRIERLTDTFAEELITYLQERQRAGAEAVLAEIEEEVNRLTSDVQKLERRLTRSRSNTQVARAQRDAKVRQLGFAYDRLREAQDNVQAGPAFEIIQAAEALPKESSGIQAPRSRTTRVVLAGILGLMAGLALALVLERFDTRIRTKQAAEKHFGHPVLAEIPYVPRRKRKELDVTAGARRRSFAADAFRLLAVGITRPPAGGNGHGAVEGGPGWTILVTSPGPAEGKSTTVANLASAFAELGRKVVVLSCDFRRPKLHQFFGVPNDRGLARALASDNGTEILKGNVRKTHLENVRVVPSGPPPAHPGELLASPAMLRAIEEAKSRADIVLLDTAPVLVASDATHLLPVVDAVVVVARARRTTAQIAERTSELLSRMNARVVGVALNGAQEAPMPRRYYYYYRPARVGVFPLFRGTRREGKV